MSTAPRTRGSMVSSAKECGGDAGVDGDVQTGGLGQVGPDQREDVDLTSALLRIMDGHFPRRRSTWLLVLVRPAAPTPIEFADSSAGTERGTEEVRSDASLVH